LRQSSGARAGNSGHEALTLNGYDGLASLRFAEVATPEPGPNDVLVKMKAASVNPVDTKIARGYGGPSQRPLPHVLGRDGAGTVARSAAR
jgi:NADPH2:quinone reductase